MEKPRGIKIINVDKQKQCDIHVVMLSFWYSTVKWLILKPLVKLSFVLNGRMIGKKKWYESHFTNPIRYKILTKLCYNLTKYVMFK